jgi:small GTP-binding protein
VDVYDSADIRNLAVIGHGASGKTTLVNAMAWLAGSCTRMGSVGDGTSLTDFTPDETEHQISVSLAMAYAEFMDTKVNLIDTPGYLDFAGEVVSGLRVADSACLVVNAVAGVEVGTERVWEYAEAEKLPRLTKNTLILRRSIDRFVMDCRHELSRSRSRSGRVPIFTASAICSTKTRTSTRMVRPGSERSVRSRMKCAPTMIATGASWSRPLPKPTTR